MLRDSLRSCHTSLYADLVDSPGLLGAAAWIGLGLSWPLQCRLGRVLRSATNGSRSASWVMSFFAHFFLFFLGLFFFFFFFPEISVLAISDVQDLSFAVLLGVKVSAAALTRFCYAGSGQAFRHSGFLSSCHRAFPLLPSIMFQPFGLLLKGFFILNACLQTHIIHDRLVFVQPTRFSTKPPGFSPGGRSGLGLKGVLVPLGLFASPFAG